MAWFTSLMTFSRNPKTFIMVSPLWLFPCLIMPIQAVFKDTDMILSHYLFLADAIERHIRGSPPKKSGEICGTS
jgi:hypothetical protein